MIASREFSFNIISYFSLIQEKCEKKSSAAVDFHGLLIPMSHNQEKCFKKLSPGAIKIYGLTLILPINFVLKIRDSCIQNFHLGSYIVGYTAGNLVLE